MFSSLRWKTAIYFVLAGLLLGGVLIGVVKSILEFWFLNSLQTQLATEARLVRELVQPVFALEGSYDPHLLLRLQEETGARIVLFDARGVPLADSEKNMLSLPAFWPSAEFERARLEGVSIAQHFSDNAKELQITVPAMQGERLIGFVSMIFPLSSLQPPPRWVLSLAFLSILVAGGLLGIAGWWRGKTIVTQLSELKEWAQRVSSRGFKGEGEVSSISIGRREDEVGQLAQALENMARCFYRVAVDLSEEKEKLETVLNTMNSGIILLDREGRVDLYNCAASEILSAEVTLREGRSYTVATRNYELTCLIDAVMSSGENKSQELVLFGPPEKIVQAVVVPVRGEEEQPVGVLVVLHDITELRRLEKVRTEFVANVSHELRTPVAAIHGFAETLREGAVEDPETAREFVEIIYQESARLGRLIKDLLELARIEARGGAVNPVPVDVGQAVVEALHKVKDHAREAGLSLEFALPAEPKLAMGNYDYLQQILLNLLENSISFTPAGGRIGVRIERKDDFLQVAVWDTGIGIPEKDLPRVFERFYRVDKSRSRKLGGTGLGLSIVKHLVESMGGRVWAESCVGEGATFYFTLPCPEEKDRV